MVETIMVPFEALTYEMFSQDFYCIFQMDCCLLELYSYTFSVCSHLERVF